MTARRGSGGRAGGAPDEPARPGTGEAPPADAEAAEPVESSSEDGDLPEAAALEVDGGDDDRGSEEAAADDGDELARVQAERDEYLSLAQRSQADFDNYRKRAARELATAGARGKADLVREMLPAVDNLERALGSAEEAEGGLAEGVRLVHTELVAALERNGIEAIEPAGEPFDPNLHEALSTRAENGAEPGLVLDVVQKGYRLDQTVLRPARVVVSA